MAFIFAVLLSISLGWANEESHEAPAEGGHEGAAPATAAPSNSKVYQEKIQKLNRVQEEAKLAEEHFKELVHKKNHAHSNEEKHMIMEQMREVYKDYAKSNDEAAKLKDEIRYRFPTGEDINPEAYAPTEQKHTMQELETETGLTGLLTEVKKFVDNKYKIFMPKPKPKPPKRQPASTASSSSSEEEKPKRIRIER
ncbi:MAG: hypothetical protein KDD22_08860 [Bdellovibrionales bacterium]|nr:hypothetical protein [Bdellovibrionales bacterium]